MQLCFINNAVPACEYLNWIRSPGREDIASRPLLLLGIHDATQFSGGGPWVAVDSVNHARGQQSPSLLAQDSVNIEPLLWLWLADEFLEHKSFSGPFSS